MELAQWFCFGILFTLMSAGLAYLSIKVKLSWWVWGALIVSCLLILFGLAWAGASFLEGVAQSGAIALICFSGPGILAISWIWKRYIRPQAANLSS